MPFLLHLVRDLLRHSNIFCMHVLDVLTMVTDNSHTCTVSQNSSACMHASMNLYATRCCITGKTEGIDI